MMRDDEIMLRTMWISVLRSENVIRIDVERVNDTVHKRVNAVNKRVSIKRTDWCKDELRSEKWTARHATDVNADGER